MPLRPHRHVTPLTLGLLAATIVVLSVVIEFLGRGPETIVVVVLFWPLAAACAVGYAAWGRGGLAVKAAVLLVGAASPFIAVWIIPATAPVAAALRGARHASFARSKEHHLAFLRKHLSEPRDVVFVQYPFVVVEGGYSLEVRDVSVPAENLDAVRDYFRTTLAGKAVTATFPEDFADHYTPNMRSGVTDPYLSGRSRGYGDAPAFIRVDGFLVNREILRRWGHAR
jgi:hypothetical protein